MKLGKKKSVSTLLADVALNYKVDDGAHVLCIEIMYTLKMDGSHIKILFPGKWLLVFSPQGLAQVARDCGWRLDGSRFDFRYQKQRLPITDGFSFPSPSYHPPPLPLYPKTPNTPIVSTQ